MAGWKLRKDKTQTDEQDTDAETADSAAPPEAGTQWETAEASGAEHTGAVLDLGHAGAQAYSEHAHITPEPDFENDGGGLHFEEEGEPLQFTDEVPVPIAAAPPLPTAMTEPTPEDGPAAADFTSTLRMNRDELANAFAPPPATGIPAVAPFVLDTPLVAPATPTTAPRLIVRVGRLSGAFDLSQEVTVIGRPDSKIQHYPDVEIDLDDAVSRRHAEVVKRDDGFFLRDAGSTNGTLLNGEKLPAHEERLLTHGDRIRVGERTEIVFE